MKKIQLNHGKIALVDDDDFDRVSQFHWRMDGAKKYVTRFVPNSKTRAEYLHRFIMCAVKGQEVDHVNGDRLDNRRVNLRFCTRTQNNANRKVTPSVGNGYRGVQRKQNRWRAFLSINNKSTYLGSFSTPEDAARCYDNAARERFGEFATPNFPESRLIDRLSTHIDPQGEK